MTAHLAAPDGRAEGLNGGGSSVDRGAVPLLEEERRRGRAGRK